MTDDFWSFSLAFYNDATVQDACLKLQDNHGGDVNVALYLLFRAGTGEVFTADQVRDLDASVAAWRTEVVRTLRGVRRRLKAHDYLPHTEAQESFRSTVKKLELNAEKLQQLALEAGAPPPAETGHAPHEAAARNLAAYGAVLGSELPGALSSVFRDRLAAVA